MTQSEADLLALLRELDDPEWPEWPQHYDRGETAAPFGGLLTRLEGHFAARCTDDQDTQDSSEYGRVVVPADATVCGTRIVVCVSKFGSLALVCADNPGAFLGTEEAELLESDYDGPSRLPSHVQRPTWWVRFFGFFGRSRRQGLAPARQSAVDDL
ncbi:hypothetical protein [Streptomyces sp. SAS_275]|uniref:hypothetical protein n=1 Tax=Streptomyces sp. SAS_275 TaxID=3412746 RepID=UPI00403CD975